MPKFIRSVLFASALCMMPSLCAGFVITIVPPLLPDYEQPLCPGEGYFWIPGYWAYGPDGYYWVPGFWVEAPEPGLLWTPGYWVFDNGGYIWRGGYWGPHVGFYGGINYGFGYVGSGFYGGRWSGNIFQYNTAVWKVNESVVHNTYYDRTVIENQTVTNNRVSFNGPGGTTAKPTAEQEAALHERHLEATSAQREHEQAALRDPSQRYSVNHGHPTKTVSSSEAKQKEPKKNEAVYHKPKAHETTTTGHEATTHEKRVTKAGNDANRPPHEKKSQERSAEPHRPKPTSAKPHQGQNRPKGESQKGKKEKGKE